MMDVDMSRFLTVTILFVVLLAFIVLFFPIGAAFQGHNVAGVVVVFLFVVFLGVPLAYLGRYGYFRRWGK